MPPRIAIPQARSDAHYIAKVMPQYCGAVQLAGGEPVVIPLDADNHEIARLATSCAAVLLPGNPADVNPEKYGAARHPRTAADDPLRDNVDELLLQDAYNLRKPILGICFGLQSLNTWRTGTLIQHLETSVDHSGAQLPANEYAQHAAVVDARSKLADIVRAGLAVADPEIALHPERGEGSAFIGIAVNSSHHQAIDRPGDGLKPVAWCPEDQVIEAVEGTAPNHWVLAVQWHPERMLQDRVTQAIWLSFIAAADRAGR